MQADKLKHEYTKDIAKLINVFLKINIWVFWYTAPNEDNNIQTKTRNIRPKIKKITYLILKFLLTFSETEWAAEGFNCLLTWITFLSDKKISFIIVVI